MNGVSKWRSAALEGKEAGFTYFDQLGGREVDGQVELWLRLMNPATFETMVVKGRFSSVDELVSLTDLWAGAKWCEAEVRHLFRRAAPSLTSSGPVAHQEEVS